MISPTMHIRLLIVFVIFINVVVVASNGILQLVLHLLLRRLFFRFDLGCAGCWLSRCTLWRLGRYCV